MYLGLDLGTSGIKAMLVDEAFATVGVAHAALTVSRPHPGWSEQDPAELQQSVRGFLGGHGVLLFDRRDACRIKLPPGSCLAHPPSDEKDAAPSAS